MMSLELAPEIQLLQKQSYLDVASFKVSRVVEPFHNVDIGVSIRLPAEEFDFKLKKDTEFVAVVHHCQHVFVVELESFLV